MASPCHCRIVILQLLLIVIGAHISHAIISRDSSRLSRDEYLSIDFEVSKFYETKDIDTNTTFDEQLLKAIRAIRHTIIQDLRSNKYSNKEVMKNSMGSKVNYEECKRELKVLVELTRKIIRREPVPLDALDFINSNGQTGAGILNGNFVWPGSYSSCIHAKINHGDQGESVRIIGRYCVAHLRAKSWPTNDLYFDDRITIRKGLCLPEPCHSYLYETDEEIQRDVDFLNRFNLLHPFNETSYETSHLYCLPDEDSPHRQPDLGAKLFIAFCCFWTLITVYANYKYHQRKEALKRLHDAVDIRMVISERPCSSDEEGGGSSGEDQHERGKKSITDEVSDKLRQIGNEANNLQVGARTASNLNVPSANSSANVTPLPSDVEETADDFRILAKLIRPKRASESRVTKNHVKQVESAKPAQKQETFDFVGAFSIESNLRWLFLPRSNFVNKTTQSMASKGENRKSSETRIDCSKQKVSSQHMSPVTRRTASSNKALIKDLSGVKASNAKRAKPTDSATTKQADEQVQAAPSKTRKRRVNIEIFDGVKVIATCYIIFGHTLMFFFGAVTDLRFGDERMFDLTMSVAINTLQVVGLFYVITGCLLTYFAFSKAKLKQLLSPLFWLFVLFARYCRLLPTYLLVFWFARHVAPLAGGGPNYLEYRTDDEHVRGYCATESWFTMLTMSAADVKIPMDCIPQAWYLSNDFRTLAVLPIYVFILAKNERLGYAAIFATFGVSTYKMVEFLRAANIDYKILLRWQPHVYALMADRLHDVYTNFYVRMSTYLLGVIVGHLLYMYETQRIKQWPDWFTRYGMKVALTLGTLFFFGSNVISSPYVNQFLPSIEQLDSDKVVLLIPLFKTSMEVSICIVAILLVTGGGFKWIQDLLSNQTMKVLSNISYAVFLSHVELMYKLPAFYVESDYWYLVAMSMFFIAGSHIISFFIYLIYEMPINNVMRLVFKRAFAAIS